MIEMITSKHNHGFGLKFDNGLSISVMFGALNYCSRRLLREERNGKSLQDLYDEDKNTDVVRSSTAEIYVCSAEKDAVLEKHGDTPEWDSPIKGWVDADEVADVITLAKNAKDLADFQAQYDKLMYKHKISVSVLLAGA